MRQDDNEHIMYVIPVDYLLHTPGTPFCYDGTCDCHDDQEAIQTVAGYVQDGLMTPEEATAFVAGKMV